MLPAFPVCRMVLIKVKMRRTKIHRLRDAASSPFLQAQRGRPGGWGRIRRRGTASRAAREALPEDPRGFRPSDGTACMAARLPAAPRLLAAAARGTIFREQSR